ncbi:hypothetical protein [Helicobacter sp. UBA3407]|nr:hypothetical protein [Helicobacter sp. UBA3407]
MESLKPRFHIMDCFGQCARNDAVVESQVCKIMNCFVSYASSQ